MLNKRNQNIHVYDEDEIDELIVLIRDSFVPAFKKLSDSLKNKIDEADEGFHR